MGVCCSREDNKNKCIDVPAATSTDASLVNSDKERMLINENDNSIVITSYNSNSDLNYNVKYKPRAKAT
jgi:hypothetical protein